MSEHQRAKFLLNPNDWETPKVGTPNQHRVITKMAQELGYSSMAEFLAYFFNGIIEPEGHVRPLQAHWIFTAFRAGNIVQKGQKPPPNWNRKDKEKKNGSTS